ncbi:MAG: tyrosine-type recombinase/integrase [Fusobacteriaceae bacterium]
MSNEKLIAGKLREKDGYYHTVITYYPENSKKQKVISKTTGLKIVCATKRETEENKIKAENILYTRRKEFTLKKDNDDLEEIMFTDYLKKWLSTTKNSVVQTTYYNYRLIIENKVIPYFENKKITLKKLRAADLQDFYSYCMEDMKNSPNTVLKYRANIRKALQTALKQQLVENNQADLVDKPKKRKFIAETMTSKEIFNLLQIVTGTSLEIPVYLGGFYGLRRGEVIGLKWSSIDFENNIININNTVVTEKGNNGKILVNTSRTKNKSSYRDLPLLPHLKERLLEIKKNQEDIKIKFGKSYNNNFLDNVCVTEFGDIIKLDYVTKKFKSILKKNNLKEIRFHDLRHSCATALYYKGVDLKSIQHWLGHSNISTTCDTYVHLKRKDIKISIAIEEVFRGEFIDDENSVKDNEKI